MLKMYYVIYFCTKYALTWNNAYTEIVSESERKPNELWTDQGRQIYNSPMQK